MNNDAIENNAYNGMTNTDKATTKKSFEHKTKILGRKSANSSRLGIKFVAPLKYLCNLWRSLDLLLINCNSSPSKDCMVSEILYNTKLPDNPTALDYMNDPTFRNNITLFVLSFKMIAMILGKIIFISIICH